MDLSNLSIFPASASQARVHSERTWEEWGGGLSLEEYIKRDKALEDLPHAEGERWTVWILAPRQNASENLDFFASCETFQRCAAVTNSLSSQDANERVTAYEIASVFTPPQHRKKGYATHMMRLLHHVLSNAEYRATMPPFPTDKWGQPPTIPPGLGNGVASTLYSEIGESFYKRCGRTFACNDGWVVRDPISTIWTVPQIAQGDIDNELPPGVEWITRDTENDILEGDSRLIGSEIRASSTPSFSFLPDRGLAHYLKVKAIFYSSKTIDDYVWGARIVDVTNKPDLGTAEKSLSFAMWAFDPLREHPQTLLISRLRCNQEQFPLLLDAAYKAARLFNFERVEIWNIEPSLSQIAAKLGGETVARHDNLPSFAWYGNGDEAGVVWKYNEFLLWC